MRGTESFLSQQLTEQSLPILFGHSSSPIGFGHSSLLVENKLKLVLFSMELCASDTHPRLLRKFRRRLRRLLCNERQGFRV